jgi:hypothetical protein
VLVQPVEPRLGLDYVEPQDAAEELVAALSDDDVRRPV